MNTAATDLENAAKHAREIAAEEMHAEYVEARKLREYARRDCGCLECDDCLELEMQAQTHMNRIARINEDRIGVLELLLTAISERENARETMGYMYRLSQSEVRDADVWLRLSDREQQRVGRLTRVIARIQPHAKRVMG